MITLQNFPKIRAPEIFGQIYHAKVPVKVIYVDKVPVQECKTAHTASLLPPISRSLPLGLIAYSRNAGVVDTLSWIVGASASGSTTVRCVGKSDPLLRRPSPTIRTRAP